MAILYPTWHNDLPLLFIVPFWELYYSIGSDWYDMALSYVINTFWQDPTIFILCQWFRYNPISCLCKGNTQKLCHSTKLCCLCRSAKPLLHPAKLLHSAKPLLHQATTLLCLAHPTTLVCTCLPTTGPEDPEDPFIYGSTFIYYYCITPFCTPSCFPLYVPSPAWDPHPFLFRSPARCVDYVVYYFIIY